MRPVPAPPRTCEHCGELFERRPGQKAPEFNRRRFCGRECATRWRASFLTGRQRKAAAARQQLLEDAEWIIGTDYPERVAQRLGYEKPESLIRSLARWGRNDLAAKLERAS